jgi:hypothetical protein
MLAGFYANRFLVANAESASRRLLTPRETPKRFTLGLGTGERLNEHIVGQGRPDPERHLAAIRNYAEIGYEQLILMQIGPGQDAFFGFFEKELRPRLARRLAA